MFRYRTGVPVRVGDIVRCHGQRSHVELILSPGSAEAEQWSIPEGGVMIVEDEPEGRMKFGRVMFVPPDAEQWCELDFEKRASEKRGTA